MSGSGGVLGLFAKLDDSYAKPAQMFVDYMAKEHGVGLPAVLRDAVFHTVAAYAFLAAACWMSGDRDGAFVVVFLLLMLSPLEFGRWKKQADRAKRDWTPELAKTMAIEALLSRKQLLFIRLLLPFVFLPSSLADAVLNRDLVSAASLVVCIVFFGRVYLDRCLPRPPSAGRQREGHFVPAAQT